MLNTSVQSSTAVQSDDDSVMREHRRKRLKNIIISRLKETRDLFEIRDVLGRSWKTGGMEFLPEQAERVVKEIELARAALTEELKRLRTEAESSQVKQQEVEFGQLFEKHMEELSEPEIEAPLKEELLVEKPVSSGERRESKVESQAVTQGSFQSRGGLQATSYSPRVEERQRVEVGKLQAEQKPRVDSVATLQSVVAKPRLFGPIDELANMTIEDFRRLGSPVEATKKIIEKVDLLAADSLLEQKKAIDAWKRSEVYKTYLAIGTESLEKKMPVSDVIEGRKKNGSVVLSSDEFNQVAEVNKKISFSR